MTVTTAEVHIDKKALQRLVEEHPEELQRLIDNIEADLRDRFGRAVRLMDKVTTPAGEDGMVIRLDKGSRRVLIKLDNGKTRMLMAHRVEIRRGRPRTLKSA
jgi:hypothetical protein